MIKLDIVKLNTYYLHPILVFVILHILVNGMIVAGEISERFLNRPEPCTTRTEEAYKQKSR